MDHGLEHFGRGDHALAEQAALGDDMLLHGGNLLVGDLHTEVSARNHDAVAFGADLVDVVNTRAIFNLGDDADITAAVLL